MRKLSAILLCGLMAVPMAKADSDQSVYVLSSDGQLSRETVADVNYITFNQEKDWISLSAEVVEWRAAYVDIKIEPKFRSDITSLPTTYTVGVVFSHKNKEPEIGGSYCCNVVINNAVQTITPRFGPENATMKTYGYWEQNSYNYARAYIKFLDQIIYTPVMEFKTPEESSSTLYGVQWIDMKLPSGKLWADRNLGATNEADYGNRFQWAQCSSNTEGYTADTYPYYTKESTGKYTVNKYNKEDGLTEISTTYNSDGTYDDAVRGWFKTADEEAKGWWMKMSVPDMEDFNELLNPENCTWTVVEKVNSKNETVKGYDVRSVRNNAAIFLPFADQGDNVTANTGGHYWTRQLSEDYYPQNNYMIAYALQITEEKSLIVNAARSEGFSIRGVYK